MEIQIPQKFRDRYGPLVENPEEFFSSLLSRSPKSFRANTLKSSSKEVKERMESYGFPIKQMEWYPDAFVSENPYVGSTLEHFMGYIYMQELASMLPPLILKPELIKAESVLDACAAPGSKTTQLAAMMQNRGVIIANDSDYGRIKALKFNLEKCGVLNTIVTNFDLRFLPKNFSMQFPLILLDAPCSSEGTIRKNPLLLSRWSEGDILSRAGLQRKLILKAYELLSPGGTLVYSTCTFAPEENESVVSHLLESADAKAQEANIPGLKCSKGIEEFRGMKYHSDVRKSLRVWPHHNGTEGFFLAKIRKRP